MNNLTYSSSMQTYVEQGEVMLKQLQSRQCEMRNKKFDTIAVHGIYDMEAALANQGSIIEPMYTSSAQHFENSDQMEAALAYLMPAWAYSRIANPTLGYLEGTLALLEGYGYEGEVSACVTGSGMAAIFMATQPFLVQDKRVPYMPINIVASARCYGGTFMLFSERYAAERGIEVRWVRNPYNLDEWASQIDAHTRFVYGEMPSNPNLTLFDITKLADLVHTYNLPLIVDATVATPALLRPIYYGADIVVHSVSKSMASSGFAIAGAIIARHNIHSRVGPDEMRANFATYVKLLPFRDHGPALSPFNALMVMNDLRTLRNKMDHLSNTSLQVAQFLSDHAGVEDVYYPGLPGNIGYELATEYMWLADGPDDYGMPVNRFGHLLSFTVKGGAPTARAFFDNLQMIWRATDLGRIKSVATIPAISTHQQQGEAGRSLADVPLNMVRLSIGGEHPHDIIADLDQALVAVKERLFMAVSK